MHSKSWHFIINPKSGMGRGPALWQRIQPVLQLHGVNYSAAISNHKGHIIGLVAQAYALGYRNFIGIGGDGTLHEIANGLFSANADLERCTIGLVPIGTGNDWVKSRVKRLTEINIGTALEAQTEPIDLGVVILDEDKKRVFLNVAGIGLDGQVVSEIEKIAAGRKTGKSVYLKGLLWALARFKAPEFSIQLPANKKFTERCITVTAAKGQWFGGGMHISPKAMAADGKLDITVIKKTAVIKIAMHLPKLFSGKIATVDFVQKERSNAVELITKEPVPVQADGEFLGEAKNVRFEVLPAAINVIG